MAILPKVVRRVALIPSELEPGRRNALPQEAGCYDASLTGRS